MFKCAGSWVNFLNAYNVCMDPEETKEEQNIHSIQIRIWSFVRVWESRSSSESELSRSCQYKVKWVKINSKWLKTVMLKDKIKRYKGQTFKWVTSCLFHQKTTVQSHLQHPMCKVYELQLELDWKERLFSLIRIEFKIYSS